MASSLQEIDSVLEEIDELERLLGGFFDLTTRRRPIEYIDSIVDISTLEQTDLVVEPITDADFPTLITENVSSTKTNVLDFKTIFEPKKKLVVEPFTETDFPTLDTNSVRPAKTNVLDFKSIFEPKKQKVRVVPVVPEYPTLPGTVFQSRSSTLNFKDAALKTEEKKPEFVPTVKMSQREKKKLLQRNM
jgi:hypothetical protein